MLGAPEPGSLGGQFHLYMSIIVPGPFIDYPPRWGRLEELYRAGYRPPHIGFPCTRATLNLFASRYWVAKSFRGIQLERYSAATMAGYSGLFRVFAMWSALEAFLRAVDLRLDACGPVLDGHGAACMVAAVRSADTGEQFYRAIKRHVRPKGKAQLEAYFAGASFNPAYLGSTVRHVFAHGILTPNTAGCDPNTVATICDTLFSFFMNVMDAEFVARISAADSWF